MRRPLRILFNGLTVVSLLAFVGVVALWLRSYRWCDLLDFPAPRGSVTLTSLRGSIGLDWIDDFGVVAQVQHLPASEVSWVGIPIQKGWVGFGYGWWPAGTKTSSSLAIVFPHWTAAAASGLPMALWSGSIVRKWARRGSDAAGRCPACGYDLRATPGRCPECGRAAEPGKADPTC